MTTSAQKASETRKYRKLNMPACIKNNKCIFKENINFNIIKKHIIINIMTNNRNPYSVKFTFGAMTGTIIVTNHIQIKLDGALGNNVKPLSNLFFNISVDKPIDIQKKITDFLKNKLNNFYFTYEYEATKKLLINTITISKRKRELMY